MKVYDQKTEAGYMNGKAWFIDRNVECRALTPFHVKKIFENVCKFKFIFIKFMPLFYGISW